MQKIKPKREILTMLLRRLQIRQISNDYIEKLLYY